MFPLNRMSVHRMVCVVAYMLPSTGLLPSTYMIYTGPIERGVDPPELGQCDYPPKLGTPIFCKRSVRRSNFLNLILKLLIKLFLIAIVFIGIIFLLNKLDFPAPKKTIEKIIPNENFKIVK